jgi:hypothetical protein
LNNTDSGFLNNSNTSLLNSTEQRKLFAAKITKNTILRNKIILGGILILLIASIILILVLRQKIWEKLPAIAKKKLYYIKNAIFWNLIIRILLEMFYPVMIAELTQIRKLRKEPKQLIGWMISFL